MGLEQQSENTHEPEIIPISTLENKTQTEKNDQIIEAGLQQQQIDLEKAAILSQEIKGEFNQSSSNQGVLNDNYEPEILIHDLRTFLEGKTPHEKYAILDAIYSGTGKGMTKVHQVKKKQYDDGFKTDYCLESKIFLNGKEIIIGTTIYLYEVFGDETIKTGKKLVLRILQEQDPEYSPNKILRFFTHLNK